MTRLHPPIKDATDLALAQPAIRRPTLSDSSVRLLLTRHKTLNWTALACLTVAATRQALTVVPEPLPMMAVAGELLYGLMLAFVAGWLFHFVVVVVPEERERRRLNEVSAVRVDYLLRHGYTLARPLARAASIHPSTWPLTEEDVRRASAKVGTPDASPPGWAGTWDGLLRHLLRVTEVQRSTLRPLYGRLDVDLVRILDAEELAFTHVSRFSSPNSLAGKQFTAYAPYLWAWLDALEDLRSYRMTEMRTATAPPRPEEDEADGVLQEEVHAHDSAELAADSDTAPGAGDAGASS